MNVDFMNTVKNEPELCLKSVYSVCVCCTLLPLARGAAGAAAEQADSVPGTSNVITRSERLLKLSLKVFKSLVEAISLKCLYSNGDTIYK